MKLYREITSKRTPTREIISYQCVIFFIPARMAGLPTARFLGLTQFFIAMQLNEFGTDYASLFGEHDSNKRGDVYGSIRRQGDFKEKDRTKK
jgi:hypothetical protein